MNVNDALSRIFQAQRDAEIEAIELELALHSAATRLIHIGRRCAEGREWIEDCGYSDVYADVVRQLRTMTATLDGVPVPLTAMLEWLAKVPIAS